MIQAEHEVYFDDSGSDKTSPIAVAACYIAKKTQWDEFIRNWDEVRAVEEFDFFHMSHFVAKPDQGHKPFCDWNKEKKDRVYRKLAGTINLRIKQGLAVTVPKESFDQLADEEFKKDFAHDHYSWAVTTLLAYIEQWRKQYNITTPMQYVFDQGSECRKTNSRILGQRNTSTIWGH